MVGVSASVNLPLHHKVQKFSSGTGSPGWSRKKGRKTLVCVVAKFPCCDNTSYNCQLPAASKKTYTQQTNYFQYLDFAFA